MNRVLNRIIERGIVEDESGNQFPLRSGINQKEGKLLFETIQNDQNIHRSLEVGFAYGISSLYICEALKDRSNKSHTIIDPNQSKKWNNIGVKHLSEAGFKFFNLLEEGSEVVLPRLLQQGNLFDFVFIDGWHTFDHTMLDCFYSEKLLRTGGYLAIHDVAWQPVRRVVDYISNYPCFDMHASISQKRRWSWKRALLKALLSPISKSKWKSMLAADLYHRIFTTLQTNIMILKKVSEDTRNFYWYNEFFRLT